MKHGAHACELWFRRLGGNQSERPTGSLTFFSFFACAYEVRETLEVVRPDRRGI